MEGCFFAKAHELGYRFRYSFSKLVIWGKFLWVVKKPCRVFIDNSDIYVIYGVKMWKKQRRRCNEKHDSKKLTENNLMWRDLRTKLVCKNAGRMQWFQAQNWGWELKWIEISFKSLAFRKVCLKRIEQMDVGFVCVCVCVFIYNLLLFCGTMLYILGTHMWVKNRAFNESTHSQMLNVMVYLPTFTTKTPNVGKYTIHWVSTHWKCVQVTLIWNDFNASPATINPVATEVRRPRHFGGLEDPYFPLNSGCLNRDPCNDFIVIPTELGRMSSPIYILKQPTSFFLTLLRWDCLVFCLFSETTDGCFQAHCLNLGSS